MTLRSPSLVFDAVTGIFDVFTATTWPTLLAGSGENLNPDGVRVLFGDLLEQPPRELVAVTGRTDDDSQSWLGSGLPNKRETFSTLVVVMTYVPNRTAAEAWARLRSIVRTADAALRDLNTGNPIIPLALATAGVFSWAITGITTDLSPVKDVGQCATAGLTITVRSDI